MNCDEPLAPLVLRILPLQFRFQLRIGLAPERPEILGHLHGAVVRREHFDTYWDAAGGDGERVRAVQVLNARGGRQLPIGGVDDLGAVYRSMRRERIGFRRSVKLFTLAEA